MVMERSFIIKPATEEHLRDILRLNEINVAVLAPLDLEQLKRLGGMAELFWVVEMDGKVAAFLIALREGQAYESVNYRWFAAHYERFLYVDRIVVAEGARKAGVGKALYEGVLAHAGNIGAPVVTAEIDIEPENAPSLRFHGSFGFREVGQQRVADGKKAVSLQALEVTDQI